MAICWNLGLNGLDGACALRLHLTHNSGALLHVSIVQRRHVGVRVCTCRRTQASLNCSKLRGCALAWQPSLISQRAQGIQFRLDLCALMGCTVADNGAQKDLVLQSSSVNMEAVGLLCVHNQIRNFMIHYHFTKTFGLGRFKVATSWKLRSIFSILFVLGFSYYLSHVTLDLHIIFLM